MEQKEKYKILCENNSIPLFAQYYWLDSICENNWDVIIIEENGEILGTMPYMITYENGEKIVQKISLTQNNGIYFFYREKLKKSDKKMSFEIKVTDLIIDEIEKLSHSSTSAVGEIRDEIIVDSLLWIYQTCNPSEYIKISIRIIIGIQRLT